MNTSPAQTLHAHGIRPVTVEVGESSTCAQTLRAHGIHLYVDQSTGRMRFRAPAGALTPLLRDQVAEVALQYEERAAIREFDGGIDRGTAERMAAADLLGEHNAMTGNGMPPPGKGLSSPSAAKPLTPKCLP